MAKDIEKQTDCIIERISVLRIIAARNLRDACVLYDQDTLKSDVRITVFTKFLGSIHSLRLAFLFLKENLINFNKWPSTYRKEKIRDKGIHLENLEKFLKGAFILWIFANYESSVRSLLRQLDPECYKKKGRSINSVSMELLQKRISSYPVGSKELIKVCTLIRNTVHNDWVFYPLDNKPDHVCYRGVLHEFKVGESLKNVTWEVVLDIAEDLIDLMRVIVFDKKIRRKTRVIWDPRIEEDYGEGKNA